MINTMVLSMEAKDRVEDQDPIFLIELTICRDTNIIEICTIILLAILKTSKMRQPEVNHTMDISKILAKIYLKSRFN